MRSLVIGTAGHIDHGKSALVRALTGTDPDRLKEEKARGITIDLGFAHLERPGVTLSFVDVPGHERFVRNMLAGAGGIDAVLLVVAADESIKPQTREHFEICRLLGIEHGVIALTKADLVDDDTLEIVALEARELVRGSALAQAPILAVSSHTGRGLDALVAALESAVSIPARLARPGLARLPIDRVFTMKGFGTVVTGTLVSGRLATGDALVVEPGAREVRVRGLHVHGHAAGVVQAPSRVAVNLSGVDARDVVRGDTLATPASIPASRRIDAQVRLLPHAPPLRHGASVRVHQGTGDALGRVSIAAVRDASDRPWRAARAGEGAVTVPAGGEGLVRIRLNRPLVVTRHDRVVLRSPAPVGTMGGGRVLDPEPASAGVRRAETLARLARLVGDDMALDVWLGDAGQRGLEPSAIVRRGGSSPDAVGDAIRIATTGGEAVIVEGRVFAAEAMQALERDVLADVESWHAAHPSDPGPLRESVRERVARHAAPALFDEVLERLRASGRVISGERLSLTSHRPRTSSADDATAGAIEALVRDAGLTPPDVPTLAAAARVDPAAAERILHRLARERRLVRLEALWFHPATLDTLREALRALRAQTTAADPATVDVGTFKARFGVSRKYAIPLLEWLDRERVTRRVGDRRVIL